MEKRNLKIVPVMKVPRCFLNTRRAPSEETALVVPKVIRQYTRKKKNLQADPEANQLAVPALPAVSEQSCSKVKMDNVKIKEEPVTENILNCDVKMEPKYPCIDKHVKIKEENVSEIKNTDIDLDQNCPYSKVDNCVKIEEENVSDINKTGNESDQNCSHSKVDEMLKIAEENVSEITNTDNDSDQNYSNSKVDKKLIKEENVTDNDINLDKNCPYSKVDSLVKIKKGIVYDEIEVMNSSDCNVNEIVVRHDLQNVNNIARSLSIPDVMSMQTESIITKPDIKIKCSSSVLVSSGENEKLKMSNANKTTMELNPEVCSSNKTLLPGGIQIKEEIESDGMELTPLTPKIINVKTELTCSDVNSKEATKLVESTLNDSRRIDNGGLKTIGLKKCYLLAVNVATADPLKIGVPKNFKVVAKSEIFTCDRCDEHFLSKAAVSRHLRVHRDTERYACTQCNLRFQYYFLLLAHLRVHSRKPFACDLCPKRFQSAKTYGTHLNTHLRERLHSCPVCLRRYACLDALQRHAARHSRADTFRCAACGAQFPRAAELRRHREAAHAERRLHPCYVCSRALRSGAELAAHLRAHADAVHECAFCSKRFTDVRKWDEHSAAHIARIHADDAVPHDLQPHACHVCRKRFTYRSTMITHLASHTGERPHSCGTCSRAYKTRSALAEHERGHSRPYACAVCGTRFAARDTLARHARRHSGERPYACAACGAAFAQRTTLAQHVRRRHAPVRDRTAGKRDTKTRRKSKT